MSPQTSQTIVTVERAADVLSLFGEVRDRSLGVTEIAGELGLSKAAVHRILASLRGRDYIELDETTRRYRLGPAAFALGLTYLARLDVRSAAVPELHGLSDLAGETATLSVLSGEWRGGESRMYVDQVVPAREIVMSVPLGQRFALHAGSSSKALLAFSDDAVVERVLAGALPGATPTTITDAACLRDELAGIRARGYATSDGERQAGAASVAAPVLGHDGSPVAALSVCGPAERLRARLDQLGPQVRDATARVSGRLGHAGGGLAR